MCARKGYAASVSQLALATAALYFPLLKPHGLRKRSAAQPQAIDSEFPQIKIAAPRFCGAAKKVPNVPEFLIS